MKTISIIIVIYMIDFGHGIDKKEEATSNANKITQIIINENKKDSVNTKETHQTLHENITGPTPNMNWVQLYVSEKNVKLKTYENAIMALTPVTPVIYVQQKNVHIDVGELINVDKKFNPDWTDLDTRLLPEWYDRAKIGIFLHWGVYSVPSFHRSAEWFWARMIGKDVQNFVTKNYHSGLTYQEFAPMFTAEFFDPDGWANLFEKAGAKYVVLTSKHHDGYTLFPSKRAFNWNSVDVGPLRDLVGELANAVRNKTLEFGVYYSLFEWFNPLYLRDRENNYQTNSYINEKLLPEIKQLITDYEPSVLWADGDWHANSTYWNSTHLLAWLYNESPVKDRIVVNDRWGTDAPCRHGDFFNCKDRFNPGHLLNHKWENAFPIHTPSWGYRRNMQIQEIMPSNKLVETVVRTVSCGGNVLINIGPTKEGTIIPIFQERLLDLGKWLEVNGESIYNTSPWIHQNDSRNGDVWYTCTKSTYNGRHPSSPPDPSDTIRAIYAIFLKWPKGNVLHLQDITQVIKAGGVEIVLLCQNEKLNWKIYNDAVIIKLPDKHYVKTKYAWVVKIA